MILHFLSFSYCYQMGRRPGQKMWESGMVYEKSCLKGLKYNYDNMTTKRYDYQGEWVHGMEQGADEMKK